MAKKKLTYNLWIIKLFFFNSLDTFIFLIKPQIIFWARFILRVRKIDKIFKNISLI